MAATAGGREEPGHRRHPGQDPSDAAGCAECRRPRGSDRRQRRVPRGAAVRAPSPPGGLDRGAGRGVGAYRDPAAGGGVDGGADRRVPECHLRPPAVRRLLPDRVARAAPGRGGRAALAAPGRGGRAALARHRPRRRHRDHRLPAPAVRRPPGAVPAEDRPQRARRRAGPHHRRGGARPQSSPGGRARHARQGLSRQRIRVHLSQRRSDGPGPAVTDLTADTYTSVLPRGRTQGRRGRRHAHHPSRGALCPAPPGRASPSRPATVAEATDLAAAPTRDARSAARHTRTWTSTGTGSAETFRRSGATRTCCCRWEAGIRPYHGQPLPIPTL